MSECGISLEIGYVELRFGIIGRRRDGYADRIGAGLSRKIRPNQLFENGPRMQMWLLMTRDWLAYPFASAVRRDSVNSHKVIIQDGVWPSEEQVAITRPKGVRDVIKSTHVHNKPATSGA